MKIATDIETELWYSILELLKDSGWRVSSEYKLFDKGIDYDEYTLRKGKEIIRMIWDNWFEGEIKCNAVFLSQIENEKQVKFQYGKTQHF